MRHIAYCVRQALRHPADALLGVREFRLTGTTHYDDHDRLESYDSGRELAHIVTLRRWDD